MLAKAAGQNAPGDQRRIFPMTSERGKGKGTAAPRGDSRQVRLKLALRENLKRRKAQARQRGQTATPSSTDDETSLNGELGKRGD